MKAHDNRAMGSSFSELLAQRQFMRFWLARIAGITAYQMLMLAIGWHMYDLTHSAWDLGLVGLCQFVPALLMALPAGHWVDRWHRGRIFACCMGLLSGVAMVLAWATAHDRVSRELIFGLAWLLGLNRAFQMPAQQAITPLLVPKSLFQRAIALSSTGVEVAVIAGPAMGGFLYLAGPMRVYQACACLFALAMALTLWVRYAHVPRFTDLSWSSLFAGVHFVRQRQVLLGAISLDLFAVLLGGATALLPVFAKDILQVGAGGLGWLSAAPAVGAALAAAAQSHLPPHQRPGGGGCGRRAGGRTELSCPQRARTHRHAQAQSGQIFLCHAQQHFAVDLGDDQADRGPGHRGRALQVQSAGVDRSHQRSGPDVRV